MDTNQTPDAAHAGAAALGALMGFLAVGLGAFGAHGLEGMLEGAPDGAERAEWWATAADYHLAHALALIAGAAALRGRTAGRGVAGCFAVGTIVFSGTLYAMALGAPRWFGAITPIGGVFLMVGWALLARALMRRD